MLLPGVGGGLQATTEASRLKGSLSLFEDWSEFPIIRGPIFRFPL